MTHLARPVMVYDGDCKLCRLAARAVAALDRDETLALVRLADDEATTLLASIRTLVEMDAGGSFSETGLRSRVTAAVAFSSSAS